MTGEKPTRSPVSSWASLIEAGKAAAKWCDDHRADARNWSESVRRRTARDDDEWRFLLRRVGGTYALAIIGALELEPRIGVVPRRRGVTLSVLLGRPFAQPAALDRFRAVLPGAPLTEHRREQMEVGLDHLEDGHAHLAGPLLMNALEGALWWEAAHEGLIVRDDRGKWRATTASYQPGRNVAGLETVVALLASCLNDEYCSFLKGVVFGGLGNPFRHGTAEEGWDLRAACLVIALVGWLEHHGLLDASSELRQAFEDLRTES